MSLVEGLKRMIIMTQALYLKLKHSAQLRSDDNFKFTKCYADV